MIGHEIQGHRRQDSRGDQALVQGPHDVGSAAQAHEIRPDDRSNQANRTDHHRIHQELAHLQTGNAVNQRQNHGGPNRYDIGFKQVSRHACTVADIIADIVGNHSRVAGIIFRNACFDLPHQVSANIGPLGENAAAKTGKDGNQ